MKKIIIAILALIFVLGGTFAEGSNLPSWKIQGQGNVNAAQDTQEQAADTAPVRTLREGKFIIGKDIAAGDYTITCTETSGESIGAAYGSLGGMLDALDDQSDNNWSNLYGSLGDMMGNYMDMTVEILGDYGDVLRSYNMKTGDSFVITLEEGTALKIADGSCTIQAQ